MPQVSIPTLNWGKRKARSQMNEVFTQDGRIVHVEIPVDKACMDDYTTEQSFLIDAANQFQGEDKYWYQILDELSCIPVCPIKKNALQDGKGDDEKELGELIDQIYHEAVEKEKLRQYNEAKKSDAWNKILWLITIPTVGLLLVFAIQHFTK